MPIPFRSARLPLSLPLVAVLLAACSSDPGTTASTGSGGSTGTGQTSSTTASSGDSSSAAAGGTGGGAPACLGPGFTDPNPPKPAIGKITATILDLAGKPVPDDLSIQVCGTDLCVYAKTTNMTGNVNVPVNKTLVKPAFKFGDARTYAKLLIPVKAGDTDFGPLTTAPLPTTGVAFVAGKALTSGDVTLEIPAGGAATVNELDYPDPIDQQLRAVTIPVAMATKVLEGAAGISQLYGVAPASTVFCPPAKITVPNADPATLPAGTDVEFLILNVDTVDQDWGTYGGWQKVSDGKVSADGKTISTTGGLPVLHLFGIRKKP